MRQYVRVTVLIGAAPSKRRTVWAADLTKPKHRKRNRQVFWVVDRQGDELNELIIANDKDVIKCYAAFMNKHYAELDVLRAGGAPLEIVR